MRVPLRNPTFVQIGFVVLLAVCTAQVGWWLLDQWLYTTHVRQRLGEEYAQDAAAADLLLQAGVDPERVLDIFPHLDLDSSAAQAKPDPEALRVLDNERSHRLNRYGWEGAFFFIVLGGGMSVLFRAVRADAVLRRRQQNFLAAVSHELKSPLANMRLAAETIALRDPQGIDRTRLLDRILGNVTRLETMVTNLLDTARIEEGELVLAPQLLALSRSVSTAVESFKERAEVQGVELQVEIPPQLQIMADPRAVDTVVRNLLENAMDAVNDKPQRHIQVDARVEGRYARLSVRDNGCGFVPDEGLRLFEMFYRPGDEMRREGHGSGLGLYIVRQLVRRSGGRVSASSDGPGRGAVFAVRWPLARGTGS